MHHHIMRRSKKRWEVGAVVATLALGTSIASNASAVDCNQVPSLIQSNDGQPAGLLGRAYRDLCPAVEAIGHISNIIGIYDKVQGVFNMFTSFIIEDDGRRMTAVDLINGRLDRIEGRLNDGFALINDNLTLLALDDFLEDSYSAREAFDIVSSVTYPPPAAQRQDFELQLSIARTDSLDALQRVESVVRSGSGLLAPLGPGQTEAQRLQARDARRATLGYVSSELYAGALGMHMSTLRMTAEAVNALLLATYAERLNRASSYVYLLIGSKQEACGHGYGAARDQLRIGNGGDLHGPSVKNTYHRSLINKIFYGDVTAAFPSGTSCNLNTNQCRYDFDDRLPGAPIIVRCSDDRTGYFTDCFNTATNNRNTIFSADPAVKVFRNVLNRINTKFGYIDKGVPNVGTIPQPDIPAGAFFDPKVYDDVGYASRPACVPANGDRYYIHEY